MTSSIREATLADADWLIGLAREKYPKLDEQATRNWFDQLAMMQSPDIIFLRGDHAALCAMVQRPFYDPEDASVHLVFGHARKGGVYEGYRMMSMMIEWARSLGASTHFGEQCGMDVSAIAKRLGAVQDEPSWVVGA